jgi:putative ABC transport system permease protein
MRAVALVARGVALKLSALDRKLVRDLREMAGQGVTISLVVAAGIAGYIALISTYGSLVDSRDLYYAQYRFGDAFVTLERAPLALVDRLEAIPGVALAYPRLTDLVRVPMEGEPQSPSGQVVSLPADGDPPLNGILLREGRLPEAGRSDEALLLDTFAERWEVATGDTLRVVMNGALRRVRITGLATSPEFVYPVSPGQAIPDDERFAVLWMDQRGIAPLLGMEGAFNDVVLRLNRGAAERPVLAEVDRLLEAYGGRGAVGRDLQTSNYFLEGELQQLRQFATVVPIIFLGVAAFLLNVVLSRLLALQRTQVASLKAFGYRDREIGLHYLKMMVGVMVAGSVLGLFLGGWLGSAFTDLYGTFFGFPVLEYRMGWDLALSAVGIAVLAGFLGAFGSLRKILRLTPAEAMRPEPPARYRPTFLERMGLGRLVGATGRMVLREVGRRPVRTGLSALGVAMAVGILVVARFSGDALDYLIDVHFYQAWREDALVVFNRPVPERGVRELAALPQVTHAEGMRSTSVRMHVGHRWREVALQGYPEGAILRQLVDDRGNRFPLPEEGVVLTSMLGELLGLDVGDTVRITLREGRRREAHLVVTGLVDEMFGLQGHMSMAELNRILGEEPMVSQALLNVDRRDLAALDARLAQLPAVADMSSRAETVSRFQEQTDDLLGVMVLILTLFASVIAAGVVYNNARVAVSVRERDLASLRVLGFTRREISSVLLGEIAVQVLLAVPVGMWVGWRLCVGIAGTVDPEQYRLPVVLSPATYAFAVGVVLLASAVSALLVRRRLDRLDLIAVLKTRE